MKAGMRRGSSGTLPAHAVLGGLLPASPPPPRTASAESLPPSPTMLLPRQEKQMGGCDSPQGKASSPPQNVPLPAAPHAAASAAAAAAQQLQHHQQQAQEHRSDFGSLFAEAPVEKPPAADVQRAGPGSVGAGSTGRQQSDAPKEDLNVQSSFGSVFLLEEPASAVAEAARAAAAARAPAPQPQPPAGHAMVPRHERSSGESTAPSSDNQ